MIPEEQRIAIAKACGWRIKSVEVLLGDIADSTIFENGWVSPEGEYVGRACHLPKYLNDLNAMHEAFRSLKLVDQCKWHVALRDIIRRECAANVDEESIDWLCDNATAAQRAEAFLRTLGLWEESAP